MQETSTLKLIVAGIAVLAATAATAVAADAPTGGGTEAKTVGAHAATVVSRTVVRPARVTTVSRNADVTAQASPERARFIIGIEAAKWGISEARLNCRVNGESGYRWYVVNSGGYGGLGQFGKETFYRGMASIGTRKVRYTTERVRTKRTRIFLAWSDGKRELTYGRKNRQRVVTVWKGTIPAHPDRLHSWAQLRIMARAMAGLGAVNDSEWEVRC